MSIIKFELKEDHLKLLKHVEWKEVTDTKDIVTNGEGSPFGGFDHYEDMGVILYGMPEGFNPLEDTDHEWDDEKKEEMDTLLSELPLAIEVILNTQSFEIGNFKTKFHDRNWKKIK